MSIFYLTSQEMIQPSKNDLTIYQIFLQFFYQIKDYDLYKYELMSYNHFKTSSVLKHADFLNLNQF